MSIISREEIRLIPLRYQIGKRPLSILLGWGELTYTRLLDGNTPSNAHAEELRRLLDDPAVFARLLETGRNRITEVAYNRSFRAVDKLLANEGGAERATRIYSAADRICALAEGDLTPSALQRLAYYAQGLCYARLGSALFDELPKASARGPEYDRIAKTYTFEEIQKAGMANVGELRGKNALIEADQRRTLASTTPFNDHELLIIDLAFSLYGEFSGTALSRMSCNETPWKKARKRANAEPGADCCELITPKSMKKYFSKVGE